MWWAGFIALAVAAAYAGVKFNGQGSAPTPTPAPEVVVAATPRAVVKAVEPIAEPTSQAAPSQGVAAIETVAVPPPPAASADTQTAKDAPSPGSIQQALDRPEPATVAPKSEKPSAKQVQAVKKAPATPPVSKSNPSTGSAARTTDTDAELLAAMLPHLKRSPNVPTSPAYEKSCGQFSGAASTECRAKFCKEKQGRDTACPVTQPAPP